MVNVIEKFPIYRHFKGGFYTILTLATVEKTGDTVVVYKSLQDGQVWTRPTEDFHGEVPEGRDNPTGQKHRFEPIPEYQYQMGLLPTDTIMHELIKREDCPKELKDFINKGF